MAGASTGKISGGANTSHSSRISGFYTEFGKIGKIVPKMLRISEKVPHKCSKFGIFMEFYYFSHENVPIFTSPPLFSDAPAAGYRLIVVALLGQLEP